jgi:cell wall-associated NlpC family hydrolase
MGTVSGWFGSQLARYLSTEVHQHGSAPPTRAARLLATLQPGDVLLVEGHSRFSTAIKYLTQSTWSHAALYVGEQALVNRGAPAGHCFVEADVSDGVRSTGAELYEGYHTRICRPVGLHADEIAQVVAYAVARLGHQYDLRNVWDLARYLFPTPPVPLRWRRRMLSLGSGDPTRAICSTLIAQAFQSIRYPILPASMKSCSCATTACLRPGTSMCHRISRWSNRRWRRVLTFTASDGNPERTRLRFSSRWPVGEHP